MLSIEKQHQMNHTMRLNAMRIGIIGWLHESNTFSQKPTTVDDFYASCYKKGDELISEWENAHHELGGFIEGCRECDVEIVPLFAAAATPGGPLTNEAYNIIQKDILDSIKGQTRIDGYLIALHGAMVSEEYESADTQTLESIRAVIGSDAPVVLSLDMHGNITEKMVDLTNAIITYRSYPHVDQRERGRDCASLLVNTLKKKISPVQAMRNPHMLIHIVQQYTGAGAMKKVIDAVEKASNAPGVLFASIAPGYIYADVPCMGAKIVVVADRDKRLAEKIAEQLADLVFSVRLELNATLADMPTALQQAREHEGTVALMDAGDNIGGGGPGDSTILFEEILTQNAGKCLVVLYDPDAVQKCAAAGIGQLIQLDVGAKTDQRHGRPVTVEGTIRVISDGYFIEPEARHGGARFNNQGVSVRIETEEGHQVILTSLRLAPMSLRQVTSLGVHPQDMKFIVVKGVTAPRAAYEPVCDLVIPVDTPGCTQAGPESFTYYKRPRPLYPLDEVEDWRVVES